MNRTATIIIAAFATLTGCAEETGTDARPTVGFGGIERTRPAPLVRVARPWGGPEAADEPGGPTPADIAPGAYWVSVEEVFELQGEADMEAGQTIITTIGDKGGIPMLQGMAPIWEEGERIYAEQVAVSTVPASEGDCTITTTLIADGEYAEGETFSLRVVYEDRVEGDDCEKLGFGSKAPEAVGFRGTFRPMGAPAESVEVKADPAG